MFKSLGIIVGVIVFAVFAYTAAYAGVLPIDDPNNRLSVSDKDRIQKALMDNYAKTKVHIVVWLPTLAKDDVLLDKAVEYFAQKGIGQKGEDNGVLILLDLDNRRSRIEVGYGLEHIMTDAATKNIQDNMMNPFFRKKEIGNGVLAGVNALSALSGKWFAEKNGDKSAAPVVKAAMTPEQQGSDAVGKFIIAIIILGFFGGLFYYVIATIAAAREERERAEREAQTVRDRITAQRVENARRAEQMQSRPVANTAPTTYGANVVHQSTFKPRSTIIPAAAGVAAGYAAAKMTTPAKPKVTTPPPAPAKKKEEKKRESSDDSFGSSLAGSLIGSAIGSAWGSSSQDSDSGSSWSGGGSSSYDSGGGSSGGGGSDSSWDD